MKTNELVTMLARQSGPAETDTVKRRFSGALGWGLFAAVLTMAIGLGVRADIGAAVLEPMFWVKLGAPLAIAAGALLAAVRLARPGMPAGLAPLLPATVVAALWVLAAWEWMQAAPAERSRLVFGETWLSCPISITALAIPVFVAVLWALRGLAPTRPTYAGGAAGLLAGAAGAAVYALHCPEMAAPFLAIWYVLGMTVPTALGAALGPRLLRW